MFGGELGGHDPPDRVLLGGVGDVRDRVAAAVGGADLGDPGPARAVRRIAEARVVLGQLEPGRRDRQDHGKSLRLKERSFNV